ncbi:hypothetical protein [Streptomyces omiyaensis]|uniref:Uncharacterized protein n=1 Tax=Streptomyces omiyaensis TaxID=68247 RepID=A0ABW7C2G4_9ACTN|nr:hypothetical protein [Streptomyces omiyaensis]GGY50252.1 hypothetical protein GCM10010363_33960 [Streptomyces omiyaensis]
MDGAALLRTVGAWLFIVGGGLLVLASLSARRHTSAGTRRLQAFTGLCGVALGALDLLGD